MDIVELLFRVKTQELDQAENKLHNVGKAAEGAEKKAKGLTDALDGFSSVGGPIGEVADRVSELKERAESSVGTFGRVGGAVTLVGVAAVAAVAGVVKLSLAVADAADELNDMANRSNISTERLSLMDAMAKMAGSSVEELVSSSERLGSKLAKQDEETGRAVTALKALGISTKDANGEAKSMIALQEEIVLAVDAATNKAKAEGAAVQLLGNDYYKLRTAIKETAEQKSEMYDYMQRVGAVVTTKLAKDSDALNDNIGKLGLSFKGMGNSIASITVPILNKVIEKLGSISEKAADIMRRWAGGSTATELADDNISRIQGQIDYKRKQLTGGYARVPGNKERLEAEIAALEAELGAAQSDAIQARRADERTKDAAINGKPAEGNRTTGGTGNGDKPKRLTPEQIAQMQQADRDQWNKELGQLYAEDLKMTMDAAKERQDADKKAAEELKKYNDELDKQAERIKQMADPYRALQQELDLINQLRDKGRLSDDEYALAVQANTEKVIEAHKKQNKSTQELSEVGQLAFRTVSTAIADLVTGADFSFKTLARSFIKALMDMYIQSQIIKPMMDWMKSLGGGGGFWGTIASALITKSANGNVFGPTGLLKSAKGNVFDGPTLHGYSGGVGVLGEAGPEAIMPLKRGANGVLGVQVMGGSTGGNINVGGIHVTVEGGNTSQQTGESIGNAAAVALMKAIANEQIVNATRYGGILNR
ncbi:phage tail tape measure C-terminal domain-containing protein [Ramlibacter sp. AN1015]|uniref:phage tail tape measure protein n=1 Tax=Ramlibacter sp. AN1015 TaxID=3133428 RepID=UPI0030BCF43E